MFINKACFWRLVANLRQLGLMLGGLYLGGCLPKVKAKLGSLAKPVEIQADYDIVFEESSNLGSLVAKVDAVAAKVLDPEYVSDMRDGDLRFLRSLVVKEGTKVGSSGVIEGNGQFLLASRNLEETYGSDIAKTRMELACERFADILDCSSSKVVSEIDLVDSLKVRYGLRGVHMDETVQTVVDLAQLPSDVRFAASVKDVKTGGTYVSINSDLDMQAASTIKPFLADVFLSDFANGRFKFKPKTRKALVNMIANSDNLATARIAGSISHKKGMGKEVQADGYLVAQKALVGSRSSLSEGGINITNMITYDGPNPGAEYSNVIAPAVATSYFVETIARDSGDFALKFEGLEGETTIWGELGYLMGLEKKSFGSRFADGFEAVGANLVYSDRMSGEGATIITKTGTTSKAARELGVICHVENGEIDQCYVIDVALDREDKSLEPSTYIGWREMTYPVISDVAGVVHTGMVLERELGTGNGSYVASTVE